MTKPTDEADWRTSSVLTSEDLAALIVDALNDAGIVADADIKRAIKVTAEEIESRKELGDYG